MACNPFERTIERTTETILNPSSKTITAAAMTTNKITSLRELLHYRFEWAGHKGGFDSGHLGHKKVMVFSL